MPRWGDPRERVLARVSPEPNTGCWLWTGTFNGNGYGTVCWSGRTELAHRVLFLLAYGHWPQPFGLHRCDQPPCVNPAHVFEGDHTDNMRDMETKGRAVHPRGEASGQSKLTAEQVREIRALYVRGRRHGVQPNCGAALGRRFGVSRSMINQIVLGKSWKHEIAVCPQRRETP